MYLGNLRPTKCIYILLEPQKNSEIRFVFSFTRIDMNYNTYHGLNTCTGISSVRGMMYIENFTFSTIYKRIMFPSLLLVFVSPYSHMNIFKHLSTFEPQISVDFSTWNPGLGDTSFNFLLYIQQPITIGIKENDFLPDSNN